MNKYPEKLDQIVYDILRPYVPAQGQVENIIQKIYDEINIASRVGFSLALDMQDLMYNRDEIVRKHAECTYKLDQYREKFGEI